MRRGLHQWKQKHKKSAHFDQDSARRHLKWSDWRHELIPNAPSKTFKRFIRVYRIVAAFNSKAAASGMEIAKD
jgi:hypothetical protein